MMTPIQQTSCLSCPDCGASRSERGVPCQACGSTNPTQVVKIGMAEEIDIALPLGLLAILGSHEGQTFRIQVQTHRGTRSDAQLRHNMVILSVAGASDVGRRGEPAALNIFLAALLDQGLDFPQAVANDERGEDAVIRIHHTQYTVQFVTVPSDSSFWKSAARGSVEIAVGVETAVSWIRNAVLAKFYATSPEERPRTVLALDTHHAGVLAGKQISTTYLSFYPDPRLELGFAATWLVGPDTSCSNQIGSAIWNL